MANAIIFARTLKAMPYLAITVKYVVFHFKLSINIISSGCLRQSLHSIIWAGSELYFPVPTQVLLHNDHPLGLTMCDKVFILRLPPQPTLLLIISNSPSVSLHQGFSDTTYMSLLWLLHSIPFSATSVIDTLKIPAYRRDEIFSFDCLWSTRKDVISELISSSQLQEIIHQSYLNFLAHRASKSNISRAGPSQLVSLAVFMASSKDIPSLIR